MVRGRTLDLSRLGLPIPIPPRSTSFGNGRTGKSVSLFSLPIFLGEASGGGEIGEGVGVGEVVSSKPGTARKAGAGFLDNGISDVEGGADWVCLFFTDEEEGEEAVTCA